MNRLLLHVLPLMAISSSYLYKSEQEFAMFSVCPRNKECMIYSSRECTFHYCACYMEPFSNIQIFVQNEFKDGQSQLTVTISNKCCLLL